MESKTGRGKVLVQSQSGRTYEDKAGFEPFTPKPVILATMFTSLVSRDDFSKTLVTSQGDQPSVGVPGTWDFQC